MHLLTSSLADGVLCAGDDLVQPGVVVAADQLLLGAEDRVQLRLDVVGLVHDDQVATVPRQLQVAQALVVEVPGHAGVHQAGSGRDPHVGCHQVAGRLVALAPIPYRAGPCLAGTVLLR